ncbi:MAG TPA: ATP-binding protein [Actinomycetes bacterium]|nr:ATP-binding protein [Actinomycetes bacterium]
MRRLASLGAGGPRTAAGYGIAALGTAAVTAGLLAAREQMSTTNVVLVYLVLVVAAAASGGLGPGATAATLGFLAFDLLFLPPYGHLKVHDQQDYVSLGVYLLIALVISALVSARERRQAQAEQREHETRTLYELSSSLLVHDSLEQTLQRVADTARSLLDLAGCAIVLPGQGGGVQVAARAGQVPGQVTTSLPPAGPAGHERPGPGDALLIPMRTAEAQVGVMVVVAAAPRGARLGTVEQRVLAAFANQAALAVAQWQREQDRARARVLEETDRLRTALLNAVSHDLRTPLASIKASASSLLDHDITWSQEQTHEFLETIDHETDRLTRLVHNLLDMSRIEAGALDPLLVETTLTEVVGPLVRLARAKTTRPIRVEVPDTLPPILVDPVRLDQVLTNLLDNARHYAPDSAVTITGRSDGKQVELRVADQGPGIPAEERVHVFDQFYRVRADGRPHGTGMGLAICRGIIEALGGSVHAEPTPGGGTTIVLTLPTADQARQP